MPMGRAGKVRVEWRPSGNDCVSGDENSTGPMRGLAATGMSVAGDVLRSRGDRGPGGGPWRAGEPIERKRDNRVVPSAGDSAMATYDAPSRW
jgi:hypothetical protein